jgi:hypothetical protein
MKLIVFNYSELSDEEFSSKWGALYSEFKTSKLAVQYYGIFFIRRLLLAISFTLIRGYPLFQVIVCSLSCFIVKLM